MLPRGHPPGLSEPNPDPVDRKRRPQAQRTRSVSPGHRSRHHNEVVGDTSTNARHASTAPALASVQSPHPRPDSPNSTRPSGHHSVAPALSTSTPEDQPGGMVDDAITSASKAVEGTNKPRGRKREEESDADALPTKRTKTDHASSNSDEHDRSEPKNDVLLSSPVPNDDQFQVQISGLAESSFNHASGRISKNTNKSVRDQPRDLAQDLLDGILPEEVSEATVGASQPHHGPCHNSLGTWQEAEAETDSQQLKASLPINKQSEDSHAQRSTVVSPPIEATDPTPTRNNDNRAFEALKCLEDEEIQKYLVARHGKRTLQVARGMAKKKFAKGAANKYNPRNGWIRSARQSREAGASESGLVIEFDMIVTRGGPSPPDPDSTKWAPAPDGATVMQKKTIGIVTTNDDEFKNVKVFTTKSNSDLGDLRKRDKLRHYAQIIRSPKEDGAQREEGVYCHLEIDCDDIDDINLNIPGPRLMATLPSYQLPHGTPYRVVGRLKDRADITLFCTIQRMAAAVAIKQIETSFDQRSGMFGRYRDTHATAGDNSTAVPRVSYS